MTPAALYHKRRTIIDQINVLRSRHRKRRGLQKLLVQLTTKQLKAELRKSQ